MLETSYAVSRQPAIGQTTETFGRTTIRVLPAASRFSLRVRAAGALVSVAGLTLDLPINRCAAADRDRWVARLGPDEWLIGGPEPDTNAMAEDIERALASHVHALVDISHRSVAIEVSGPEAAATLNAGCPLDLNSLTFPSGSATRTLMGKAEIVLAKSDDAPTYRVECWRSFATYVHGFLREAARQATERPR